MSDKPEAEVVDATALHGVFYTDGGCRPSSRGTAGWGLHGYLYHNVPAKQGAGAKGVPTPLGYDITASGKPDITIAEYVDGYGAILDSTNNHAEVMALIRAFEIALSKGLVSVTIRADSRYTLDGHGQWMHSWAKNNWQSRSGTAVANVDVWQRVFELDQELKAKGVKVVTQHVKGHSGEPGNDMADHAATCGVISGFNKIVDEHLVYSDAKGYWTVPRENNRMLSNPFWYFTTQDGAITTGSDGRHLYFTGKHNREEMETVGKSISDTGMALVLLKDQDPVLETVRNAFLALRCGRYQGLVIGDMAGVMRPAVYADLQQHGDRLLLLQDFHRRVILGYDDSLVGEEIYPPRLAFRWADEGDKMRQILELYVAGDTTQITRTDITALFYEPAKPATDKSKKIDAKLKAEIKPGHKTLKTTANYTKANGQSGVVELVLNMDQDIPDRNTLSALSDDTTRVHVVTWRQSATAVRYATVIECNGDTGLWVGPYSNLKLVPA